MVFRRVTVTKRTLSPDEIVNHVLSNARLEGIDLDDETVRVVRRVASKEMTQEEALKWKLDRVEHFKAQARKVSIAS
jgi:hypothetical protein